MTYNVLSGMLSLYTTTITKSSPNLIVQFCATFCTEILFVFGDVQREIGDTVAEADRCDDVDNVVIVSDRYALLTPLVLLLKIDCLWTLGALE